MFADDNQQPLSHSFPGSGEEAQQSPEDQLLDDPISKLERERDEMKAIAMRSQADFVNYKRRVEEERWALARNVSNQVISRLLPIVDDLERAVDALPEDAPESWGGGVKLVLQNMGALVSAEGVTKFEPAPGDAFDPAEHEAVYHQPTDDQPAGCVLSTFRSGYRSQDRVLRPAQVIVARAAESPEQTNDGNQ